MQAACQRPVRQMAAFQLPKIGPGGSMNVLSPRQEGLEGVREYGQVHGALPDLHALHGRCSGPIRAGSDIWSRPRNNRRVTLHF